MHAKTESVGVDARLKRAIRSALDENPAEGKTVSDILKRLDSTELSWELVSSTPFFMRKSVERVEGALADMIKSGSVCTDEDTEGKAADVKYRIRT
jgi:hypothetical protein